MAYNPTEWQTGDTVTAEKLNKLEQGVEDAQLPAVTADDNGDVLTVVEGEWAKAVPSGKVTIIPLVYDDDTETYTATVITSEILEYLKTGHVIFKYHDSEYTIIYNFTIDSFNYYNGTYTFGCYIGSGGGGGASATIILAEFIANGDDEYPAYTES